MKPGWRRKVKVQASGLYAITLGSVARYGSTSSSFRDGSPITMILPGSAMQDRILIRLIDSRYMIVSRFEHVAGHLGDARTGPLDHHLSTSLKQFTGFPFKVKLKEFQRIFRIIINEDDALKFLKFHFK